MKLTFFDEIWSFYNSALEPGIITFGALEHSEVIDMVARKVWRDIKDIVSIGVRPDSVQSLTDVSCRLNPVRMSSPSTETRNRWNR